MRNYLLFLLFFGLNIMLHGQVMINEYSAANLNNILDNYGRTEDWIELYNSSEESIDLGGYFLSDKADNIDKWEIPAGIVIPAKGYVVFWCSGRDETLNVDGEEGHHTNFKLQQTKGNEVLVFSTPDLEVIDEIPLEITLVEHSWARVDDGSDEWRVCTQPSFKSTNNFSPKYKGYSAAPTMDKEAGFYENEITVSITNNEPNSTLRYTLDGTNVRGNSPVYNGPLVIDETTVIKARSYSFDAEILPGKMDFSTYFIDVDHSLAVFSVAANQVLQLAGGAGEVIPIGSIEYFNLEKEREATSYGSLNRHGQDSWVLDHRSLDWVSRDEMGYSRAVEAPLFSNSDRDQYQKFMFRNSGDDNYPALQDGELGSNHVGSTHIRDEYVQTLAYEGGLKLDIRAVERVVLYLNGQYWGVYGMRERPVDHDYTKEYYDQGKYDIQYLATWGTTDADYGGRAALEDWFVFRDFILENDMSLPENYEKVKDQLQVQSLVDYMLANLNVVAVDWLNYNTGWWRGLDEDGDHKKWEYILWDLDATFGYYINYTNVPTETPDALVCDIEDISESMDDFFRFWQSEFDPPSPIPNEFTVDPSQCNSILNGSSPYPASDSIINYMMNTNSGCCDEWNWWCNFTYDDWAEYFENVDDLNIELLANCPARLNGEIDYDPFNRVYKTVVDNHPECCDAWGNACDQYYNYYSRVSENQIDVPGNIGQHEKILLKLIEENDEFRQLFYSRQADLINTVYSCENMITTLDRMAAVIEPEMPQQIERWGGTMQEWMSNLDRLRNFILERCENLETGLPTCYDLSGPFDLTLKVEPEGAGEIDLNSLEIESFPWTGIYYGDMKNRITAKAQDNFRFSHWETSSGNVISADAFDRKAEIELTVSDTLTAVFESTVSTSDLENKLEVSIYPNPTDDVFTLKYTLPESEDVRVSLLSLDGREMKELSNGFERKSAGRQVYEFRTNNLDVGTGFYFVKIEAGEYSGVRKLSIIR